MRTWLLCWFLVLLACDNKPERVRFDPGAMKGFEQRFNAVLARPDVDKAFDTFVNNLMADLATAPAIGDLAAACAADERIMKPAGELMMKLQESPVMLGLVRRLLAENPGMTPDRIAALVGEQIQKTFSSPAINASFTAIATELIKRLDVGEVTRSMRDRLTAAVETNYEDRWSKRIIELNGGKTPSPGEATRLWIDHAFEPERLAKFVHAVLANPTTRREAARLLTRVLATPEVAKEIRVVLADLAQDATIRAAALRLFDQLLATPPDDHAIDTTLRSILLSAKTVDGASRLVRVIFTTPQTRTYGNEALAALAADQPLAAAFRELTTGW